jgi:hypothetical protein
MSVLCRAYRWSLGPCALRVHLLETDHGAPDRVLHLSGCETPDHGEEDDTEEPFQTCYGKSPNDVFRKVYQRQVNEQNTRLKICGRSKSEVPVLGTDAAQKVQYLRARNLWGLCDGDVNEDGAIILQDTGSTQRVGDSLGFSVLFHTSGPIKVKVHH